MAHKGKVKVHGPRLHRKAPEHQVPPPDLLPPEFGRRNWFVHSWPVKHTSAMPFLSILLAIIGLAMIAFGEVDWHFCLPVVIVLFVVAILALILGRKR